MSSTVHIDRVETLQMSERRGGPTMAGVIVELTRVARLTGIAQGPQGGAAGDPWQDYQVLQQALNDVSIVDLGFAIGRSPTGHEHLVCVDRQAHLVPGEKDVVDITCRYERRGMSLDSIGFINDGDYLIRGSAGMRQITTQKDRNENLLVVPFTYPLNYTERPDLAGKVHEPPQVADMQVMFPNDVLEFTGRLQTNAPGAVARSWREHTNDAVWQGDEPGTWLCASVNFEVQDFADADNQVYDFTFVFQHDDTGWNPDIFFRDPRTGRAAVKQGQTSDDVMIEVEWYPQRNFGEFF